MTQTEADLPLSGSATDAPVMPIENVIPWTFDDANPIANFTVALELSTPIMPSAIREIASKHSLFKRELPRRQEQPLLMLPIPGSPMLPQQTQIAGVVFDSVSSDGTVARSLTIAPNQISFMTANYPRWKEFQPVFERLFTNIIKILSDQIKIVAITLAATNRFRWTGGASEVSVRSLLNQECNLFASHMLEANDHCHSFHGYLEKRRVAPVGHYIRNVNVQTGDNQDDGKVATVHLSHRLVFDTPVEVTSDSFSGIDSALCSRITNEMHDSNNKMFVDVISPEISKKMPGLFL